MFAAILLTGVPMKVLQMEGRTQGIGEWARGWVFFANAEFYKQPHIYLSSALASSPLAHGWIGECDRERLWVWFMRWHFFILNILNSLFNTFIVIQLTIVVYIQKNAPTFQILQFPYFFFNFLKFHNQIVKYVCSHWWKNQKYWIKIKLTTLFLASACQK